MGQYYDPHSGFCNDVFYELAWFEARLVVKWQIELWIIAFKPPKPSVNE